MLIIPDIREIGVMVLNMTAKYCLLRRVLNCVGPNYAEYEI